MTKAVLDDVVVAGNSDMRELAFKNLEAAIAGFDRCAGMLDDRHPLAQTLIGLTQMAGRSLRAISLVPAAAIGGNGNGNGNSEPGTALMKLPETENGNGEEPKQDTRKPWAVAHAKRKHYCIGRDEGCVYSTHGNSIGRHQNKCVYAARVRAKQAADVLGDAVKLGTIEGDGGQIMRLPSESKKAGKKAGKKKVAKKTEQGASSEKPAAEKPTLYCAGRTSGCEFTTESGRWLARHQNNCEHAKAAEIRGEGDASAKKATKKKAGKTAAKKTKAKGNGKGSVKRKAG